VPDSISMEVKKIPFLDILMDKPDPKDRTISKEFCENLARSIEAQGLLYEPYVRPVKDNPGKFRVIAGRHRMIACKTFLKWTEIPCKVVPDSMSDEEVKAIEIADNLWRNNLDEGQLKRALAEWHSIYLKSHPLADVKAVGAKRQKLVEEKVAEAESKGETVDEAAREAIVEAVAAETKPFSKVLQETLKVSPATAGRLARVAKNLDASQIDVLDKHNVTNATYDKLAGLGSKDLIDKAIGLISDGVDPTEAIRQAAEVKGKRKAAKKKQPPTSLHGSLVPKASETPPRAKDSELTDAAWMSGHCDVMLKTLKRSGPYKRDAILYRRIIGVLSRFRTIVKKPLDEAKHVDGNGAFYASLFRLVHAMHPSLWVPCGTCNGTGSVLGPDADGREVKLNCPKCHGGAYLLRLED
jgi:ParB-like chromosome segregation protein Spo0J